jgi:hypothetical protein
MLFTTLKFSPQRRWLDLATVLGLVVGASLLIHAARLSFCPLKRLTGFPCPTCGSTRAFLSLARGNFATAWTFNPLAAVMFSLLGLYALTALTFWLTTRRIPVMLASRKTWCRLAVGLLLLAIINWIFMIVRG